MTDGKRGSSGVPEGWQQSKLGELTQFINGKAHENSISEDGSYVVVNSKFISSEGEVVKYSDECFCPAQQNDVLIVMSDVPNGRAIAKCFYVNKDDEYTVNQRIGILRAKRSDPKFLYYSVNRNAYFLSFDDGIKQTNLRKDEVLSCPIPLPPLEEQRKVAAILSAWDEAIEQQTRLIELKRERKRGLMQQLLTGRVRFKEFTGLEWDEVTLEKVASFIGRGMAPTYVEGESVVYAVNQKCVRNGGVSIEFARAHDDHASVKEASTLQHHDICINSTGTGTAGRIGLWEQPKNEKYYFVDTHVTILRLQNKKASPKFITDLLQTPQLQNRLEAECIFGGTNQVELSRSDFAKLLIRLPSFEEQQKIATVLSAADAELETLTAQLAAFKTQKRGLMQRLLTGKTRVQLA